MAHRRIPKSLATPPPIQLGATRISGGGFLEHPMSVIRVIALSVILAFGGCVIASGFLIAPASANKMDGKPGGAQLCALRDAEEAAREKIWRAVS